MVYEKKEWKNRVVEKPMTFVAMSNLDGTVTLQPKEGNVAEEGTPVDAENMNRIEKGIADAHDKLNNFKIPVMSVNGKNNGDIILTANDIKTSENKTIETKLTELFQYASNGKNAIAGAVGGVTGQNSFQDIANYITTKRNDIGSRLGASDYGNMQRLVDWTFQRQIDLANQLVAKGVGANNQENLGQLVNKVSQIQTGGWISSGDIVWSPPETGREGCSIKLEINSLNFRPKVLVFRIGGLAYMRYNEKFWLGSLISIQFPDYTQYTAKTFSFHDSYSKDFIIMNVDLNSIFNNGFIATVKVAIGPNQSSTSIRPQQTYVEWIALA